MTDNHDTEAVERLAQQMQEPAITMSRFSDAAGMCAATLRAIAAERDELRAQLDRVTKQRDEAYERYAALGMRFAKFTGQISEQAAEIERLREGWSGLIDLCEEADWSDDFIEAERHVLKETSHE